MLSPFPLLFIKINKVAQSFETGIYGKKCHFNIHFITLYKNFILYNWYLQAILPLIFLSFVCVKQRKFDHLETFSDMTMIIAILLFVQKRSSMWCIIIIIIIIILRMFYETKKNTTE